MNTKDLIKKIKADIKDSKQNLKLTKFDIEDSYGNTCEEAFNNGFDCGMIRALETVLQSLKEIEISTK